MTQAEETKLAQESYEAYSLEISYDSETGNYCLEFWDDGDRLEVRYLDNPAEVIAEVTSFVRRVKV